jgi:peptide chain release factor subunit 1
MTSRRPIPDGHLRDVASTARRSRASVATLRRLSRMALDGHPVLSVYVDLDPSRFATAAARASEQTALLTDARRRAVDAGLHEDVDVVARLLATDPALERGNAGLAIFSAHPAGMLEVVLLPRRVDALVAVDTIPWLAPMVPTIPAEGVAVAVVDRRSARVLHCQDGRLVEAEAISDDVHGRHDQGGWSQSRYQRGIEEAVAQHVRHVAGELEALRRRDAFRRLVVVAAGDLWPVVRRALSEDLTRDLAGVVEADLAHADVAAVAHAVWPVLERIGEADVVRRLARIQGALGVDGAAAAGPGPVLEALAQQRVATLVVDPASRLLEAGVIEQATCSAAAQDAEVLAVTGSRLEPFGGIAALLRW